MIRSMARIWSVEFSSEKSNIDTSMNHDELFLGVALAVLSLAFECVGGESSGSITFLADEFMSRPSLPYFAIFRL